MKHILTLSTLVCALTLQAQTNAYIKLHDSHKRHPRVESITFGGDVPTAATYDAIYGHGAVIENPWVAYRVYMDHRQSLDLYVKATPRLELEQTGFYTTPEQLKQGYGCDVLWAGKSVGAGSFRGWADGATQTIDSVASRTQRVVSPSTVEVTDEAWIYNGHPVNMTQLYTISPDSRVLDVEIFLSGHQPGDLFATGVQKLETHHDGFILPTGLAASWGANVPDKGHPELVEEVGLGIEIDPSYIVETREDELNYLFVVRPDVDGCIRYRVIATGSRQKEGPSNAAQWLKYIKTKKY